MFRFYIEQPSDKMRFDVLFVIVCITSGLAVLLEIYRLGLQQQLDQMKTEFLKLNGSVISYQEELASKEQGK